MNSSAGKRKFALVSMPWMTPDLPSIQLATCQSILAREGYISDKYEFYVDLAAIIGVNLYQHLDNDSFVLAERLFAQFYFDKIPEPADPATGERVSLGASSLQSEDDISVFLSPILENFLDACFTEVDWQQYAVVCFSLTTVQTAASMALAQRVKRAFPAIRIVFGGTSCAGVMGKALAQICPEVDIVVHAEAENVLPKLLSVWNEEAELGSVPGITWRQTDNTIRSNAKAAVHNFDSRLPPLDYDSYFARAKRVGLLKQLAPWIPFETSRGCWYGQKVQCTFCGLNEIIKYREAPADGLIEELSRYADRYGISRFFAVDLIMPRKFVTDVFPEIERQGHHWQIFYEIKSNVKYTDFQKMVRGQVRAIQPGIESLDDEVLKLMRKGVSAAQNLELLIWCRELDVVASWNFLLGFPGENIGCYDRLLALVPHLFHLPPPSGAGDFEVHRFSPYFENPAELGIEILGPDARYKFAFPVPEKLLSDLVYRFDFRCVEEPVAVIEQAKRSLHDEIIKWNNSYRAGATLTCRLREDGGCQIIDGRCVGNDARVYSLDPAETSLYAFLASKKPESKVVKYYEEKYVEETAILGGSSAIREKISDWIKLGLVVYVGEYVLAIATWSQRPQPELSVRGGASTTQEKYVTWLL